MYHYKIRMNILSNDLFLETEIRKITPLKGFEHEFKTCSIVSPNFLQDCDIIIIDLPIEHYLQELRSLSMGKTLIVLCLNPQQLTALSKEIYEQIDEVLLKPFHTDFVFFQMKKILLSIKRDKDQQLSQIYLESAINSIPDLVWFKDLRGSHVKVNDAFCHAVGKTKEDVEGRGHYYIWDLEREEYEKGEYVCLETEEMVLAAKKTCLFNEKVKSKHGMRQFRTYKSPLFDENGEIMGTVGIAHDVTDLENMSTELEIILCSMPFAILVKDNDGSIVNANERFEKFFHTKKGEMIGKNYDIWKYSALKNISDVNHEGYSEAILDVGDEERVLEIHEEPIYDVFHNLVGQLCICRDVTIERALEQQILYNSNTDFLTGLSNRRYFYKYVNENRGRNPISLIYVDLDYFKKVNDTYGHQAGDEALIVTANLLRKCFPDAFIARLGGDEFLITIMGECSVKNLQEKAGQLLNEMQQTFQASERFKILSASIGIAQTSDTDMKIDALILQSDIALYQAKQRGRSQYRVYNSELENK